MQDYRQGIKPYEIPAFEAFFAIINNDDTFVEHSIDCHPAIVIQRPQVNMTPRIFTVSFWGHPGPVPDPYPNIMFNEIRLPGPRSTIWIGFSHSGVYLGGSPAPDGFREYIETRIDKFLFIYLSQAILLHAGKPNN